MVSLAQTLPIYSNPFQSFQTLPSKSSNKNYPVHPHAKRRPQGASSCFWNDLRLVRICNKITTNQIKYVRDMTTSFVLLHLATHPFSRNSSLVHHVFDIEPTMILEVLQPVVTFLQIWFHLVSSGVDWCSCSFANKLEILSRTPWGN